MKLIATALIFIAMSGAAFSEGCKTTLDCAEQMLADLRKMDIENDRLTKRISDLHSKLEETESKLRTELERLSSVRITLTNCTSPGTVPASYSPNKNQSDTCKDRGVMVGMESYKSSGDRIIVPRCCQVTAIHGSN